MRKHSKILEIICFPGSFFFCLRAAWRPSRYSTHHMPQETQFQIKMAKVPAHRPCRDGTPRPSPAGAGAALPPPRLPRGAPPETGGGGAGQEAAGVPAPHPHTARR